ncbi:MAG: hypothetical protein AAB217_07140, partial [Chloroflexota bacterium]
MCNFLLPLLAGFSPAQLRHVLNFIEALLVCSAKHKTLAAVTRLLRLDHADQFALADLFRVSPWSGEQIRSRVTLFILKAVTEIQTKTGWRLLFLSLDDSLGRKDIATHKLQAVSLHFDHVRQRRQKGQYTNGSNVQLYSPTWLALDLCRQSQSPFVHLLTCRVVAPLRPPAYRTGHPPLDQRQPDLPHPFSGGLAAPLSLRSESGLLQTEPP